MKFSLSSLVILLLLVLYPSDGSTPEAPTGTPTSSLAPTSTGEPSTTTTSTGEPSTTSTGEPSTASTGEPTTTEAPPTTTTISTTSTTVTTSTKEPVTTVPTVPTTKSPEPDECSFNVTQNHVTCIRADLKMSFIVSLEGTPYHINLGCNASYDLSDCSSNDTQTLFLNETTYSFIMVFENDKDKFYVKEIAFRYNLPEGKGMVFSNTTKIFSVKTGNSYMCKTKSDVQIGNVTIEFTEMQVQAFLKKDDTKFGTAEECDADDKVSDVVPIAVGVALAALIIVVLIAYLVGRRRSRQSGYQSV